MRFEIIASKYIYYLRLAGYGALLISLAILNTISINSGQIDLIIIVMVISSIFLLLSIRFFTRFIYLSLDTDSKKVLYGNLFFFQESPYKEIKSVKKSFLIGNTYILEISKRRFLVTIQNDSNVNLLMKILVH